MKRPTLPVLLCLAAMTVAASPASGQGQRHAREGFWFSGGLGVGSFACADCGDRLTGLSGGLSAGGTLGQSLLVGAGTTGWTKTENGVTLTVGTLDARFRLYTSPNAGFFFTFGGGLGSVTAAAAGFGSGSQIGVGILVGAGFDMRMGSTVSLTPYAHLFTVQTTDITANVIQFGLAITVH